MVLLDPGVLAGALDDEDLGVVEVGDLLDRVVRRGDGTEGHLHVRVGEVDFLGAVLGDGEVGKDDVDLARLEELDPGRGVDGDPFELDTHVLGETLAVGDVVALVGVLAGEGSEGGLVGEGADVNGAVLLDLLRGAGADVARGLCRASGVPAHVRGSTPGSGADGHQSAEHGSDDCLGAGAKSGARVRGPAVTHDAGHGESPVVDVSSVLGISHWTLALRSMWTVIYLYLGAP